MSTNVVTVRELPPRRIRKYEPPYAALTLVAIILAWQVACSVLKIPDYLLPAPAAIARDIAGNTLYFLPHTGATSLVIVIGFLASVAIGLPIAILLSYSRPLNKSLYPLIV